MRADFAAVSQEASYVAAALSGNANSGQAGEGTNHFITVLIGAMALQQNAVCLQGVDAGGRLPVLPVSPGEGNESQGMLMIQDNGGVSEALLSMLTVKTVPVLAGSGSQKLQMQETVQEEAAGGSISGRGFEKAAPPGAVAGQKCDLNSTPVITRFSVQHSPASFSEKATAVIEPLNTGLSNGTPSGSSAGRPLDNAGGGLSGLIMTRADTSSGESPGHMGHDTERLAGEGEKLLNVAGRAPDGAEKAETAKLPASRPEVKERHGMAGDSPVKGLESINPEKPEADMRVRITGVRGETAAATTDGGQPAADDGRTGEQVQVNAGSINIQNVTPKKFPAEILPHVLSIVRSAGNESRVTVIRLKLVPENMGEINIRLSYVKGELTAHFFTNSGLVREAVESSFPQLRDTLAQYNVDLGEAAAFVGQEQQGRQGAGHAGPGRGGVGKFNSDLTPGNHGGLDPGEAALKSAGGNERLVNILV